MSIPTISAEVLRRLALTPIAETNRHLLVRHVGWPVEEHLSIRGLRSQERDHALVRSLHGPVAPKLRARPRTFPTKRAPT